MNKNIQTYYCILWVPTAYHKPLSPLDTIPQEKFDELKSCEETTDGLLVALKNGDIILYNINISDVEIPLYLDIILKKPTDNKQLQKRSIEIKCKKEKGPAYTWKLFLKSEDVSRNGLVKYSYTYDDREKNPLLNREGNITHAVYHAIKQFYHSHIYHESCKDSILDPFCSKTENVDIKGVDNKALMHYLNIFEKMFSRFVEDFSGQSKMIDDYYSEGEGEETGRGKNRAFAASNFLLNECTNALGISLFTNSLLLSKYNHSFKITSLTGKTKKTIISDIERESCNEGCTICQKAINLLSSVEQIRLIKIRCRNNVNAASALLNADQHNELKYSLDELKANHEKLGELQSGMSMNITEVKDLHSALKHGVDGVKDLQGKMNSAINDVKIFQQNADKISKRWNTTSFFIGAVSIFLGIVSFCIAKTALTFEDFSNKIEAGFAEERKYTDSLVNENTKLIIDSLNLLPAKNLNANSTSTMDRE